MSARSIRVPTNRNRNNGKLQLIYLNSIYCCINCANVMHFTTSSLYVVSHTKFYLLETDPQCNTNISATDGSIKEFDYVEFQCTVNFSGHWAPSMQWSKGGNALKELPIVLNRNISQNVQQFTSVINMQVSAEDNDAVITCETFFIETAVNINKSSASNVPEYLFSWNTTLIVLCR